MQHRAMLPLSTWPAPERRGLAGLFTDIDDTLTCEGVIAPAALQALHDLRGAGLHVIAITGRAIGWCHQHIAGERAAPWPVDAIVAENGALAWVCSAAAAPRKHYQQDAAERARNMARMRAVRDRVLREVPGARTTGGDEERETDMTFDHAEHCVPDPRRTAHILDILHAEGMHTSVSSIHIHGCYGDFDKWQGANWILRLLLAKDLRAELPRWAFIGDSGNDQPMFRHFLHSVGVANIRHCADRLAYLPRYVTQAEQGAGFAEMANAILQARRDAR